VSFDRTKIAFIKALDALIDYHHMMREKHMSATAVTTAPPKKTNKFISFMEHVGHFLKVGLPPIIKVAETAGEEAVSILAPGASALFNQTVAAIATAEENYPASGSGAQKSAAVVSIMGNLIKQALTDAGMTADNATVQKYVEAALLIAKVTPVLVSEEETAAAAPPAVAAIPAASTGSTYVAPPNPTNTVGSPVVSAAIESGTSSVFGGE
jgi:hypothetical protein